MIYIQLFFKKPPQKQKRDFKLLYSFSRKNHTNVMTILYDKNRYKNILKFFSQKKSTIKFNANYFKVSVF